MIVWLEILAVVALLLAGWLWWTADRLDRVHHRIDLARVALDTQLARRVAAVHDVVDRGAVDDAEALLLLDASQGAGTGEQPAAESRLSQALRSVFDTAHDDPGRFADLGAACRRVELARRFHNDQVASARLLRSLTRVRLFQLAGHAPEPETVDLDDVPPAAL